MNRCVATLNILTLAIVLVDETALARAADKPESFSSVVDANFDKWDRDKDGKLSPQEIDAAVANHSVTGDAAAAVAAIHVFQRNKKNQGVALTRELLAAAAKKKTAAERRDQTQHLPHFEANYAEFRRHIAKAPKEIFVGNAPALEGFHQGNLGDCYFLAAVGSAINRNPALVKRMFKVHPDGSCELTFPTGQRTHVNRLTDADIALGSNAGEQGRWLNVLEKGFGQLKVHSTRSQLRTSTALDVISKGGDADATIKLLTGHKAEYLAIRHGKGKAPPQPATAAKVHALMQTATAVHPLMCVGTPNGAKLPPGVPDDHDYGVLGFEAGSGLVHVWNPWGNKHKAKGPPGLVNGYDVDGGHFKVPLQEFVQIFEGVYYETGAPPRKRR